MGLLRFQFWGDTSFPPCPLRGDASVPTPLSIGAPKKNKGRPFSFVFLIFLFVLPAPSRLLGRGVWGREVSPWRGVWGRFVSPLRISYHHKNHILCVFQGHIHDRLVSL